MCASFLKIKLRADSSNPGSIDCEEKIKISAAHIVGGKYAIKTFLNDTPFLKILTIEIQ